MGGILGGGGGGGNSTTVQKADPWSGQQPYLTQQFQEAQKLYQDKTPQLDPAAYNQALEQWKTQGGLENSPTNLSINPYGNGSGGTWYQVKGDGGFSQSFADQAQAQSFIDLQKNRPDQSKFIIPGSEGSSALAPAYYPGQTIANQSPETLQAQQLAGERAMSGSPLTNAAKNYTQGLLGGDYLKPDSNPYLDGMFSNAADQVQQRVNSAFGGAGRYGSGINQEVMTRELGKTAQDVYGQNYENERNRQMQGLLFAPQLANQDYFDIGQLANVGASKDTRSQDLINSDIDKYNYNSNLPANALRNYIGLTGGNYGGTTTSSTPYYSNQAGNALSGGLLGSQLGGMIGGGYSALPWLGAGANAAGLLGSGAGIGGLLGAGLGLLSDRRVKHDINLVDNVDGLNVYSFRYLPFIDPAQHVFTGVMAQEVADKYPDAVYEQDGIMRVDYSQLPVSFRLIH